MKSQFTEAQRELVRSMGKSRLVAGTYQPIIRHFPPQAYGRTPRCTRICARARWMRLNAACSHRVWGGSRGTAHVHNFPVSAASSQSGRIDSPLHLRGSTSCFSTHGCFKSCFHSIRSCSRLRSSFFIRRLRSWMGGRRGTMKCGERGFLS